MKHTLPTITDSQPVSIRLDNDLIEYLKLVARCKSVAQGYKIAYTDLIREAILAAYPVKEDFTKMSDIERICWTQVYTGVERMKITGEDICIISQGGSRHPVGSHHTVALVEHVYAAREHGLHIIPISVTVTNNGQSEATEDYVLLSKKDTLSPQEIKALVPDYTPGNFRIEATKDHPG